MHDDDTEITCLLDEALDAVLRARLAAGGIADARVPLDALDAALVADAGAYRRALRAHRRAYDRLRPVVDPDHADLLIFFAL